MKKVLITGGAGFIGSNFARKFLELRYDVNLIDRKGVNLWRLQDLKDKIKINYVDIENYDELEPFLSELNPQIILHFAAAGTYTRRPEDIRSIIDANLLGTINLVNACSKIKIECFINTGSSSEYGAKEKPMKENDLLEANNLYGITKAASTLYCQYMAKKLDLPIVTARPFAVYGYFEEKERLIPTIIKSCLENTELELSSPSSVRDFVFIEDVVKAYLAIIENIQKVKGEIFNVGTGVQTTIDEAVNMIKDITQSTVKSKYGQIKPAHWETKNWVADISKIKKRLSWQPEYGLKKGLAKDIKWFKKNFYLYL